MRKEERPGFAGAFLFWVQACPLPMKAVGQLLDPGPSRKEFARDWPVHHHNMTWIILSGPIVVYNERVRGAASSDSTTTVG